MSKESQTLIGVVRYFVEKWRKQEGWTEESLSSELVKVHALMDGPSCTGIRFEPATRDVFIRSKVNSERIYRWLDDETKCVNLMPANFLPVVLTAMPVAIRLQCVNALLKPLDLVACQQTPWPTDSSSSVPESLQSWWSDPPSHHPGRDIQEESDSVSLEIALRDLDESIQLKQRIRQVVERALENYSSQHPYSRLL